MPPKTNTDGTTEGAEGKQGANDQTPKGGEKPPEGDAKAKITYDTWVGDQSVEVKGLLDGHTAGLTSALQSEREARKALEAQLKEAAGKAEGETKVKLEAMAAEMAAVEQRADFFVDAQAAGIGNLKLAYTVAVQDDLIDKRGRVNFEQMKKDYPELFGDKLKTPKGHQGSGANPPVEGIDMNQFIRNKAAGK